MYQPHPSTSSGFVDGTETRSVNLCLQSGWTGSHARTRNHYGPLCAHNVLGSAQAIGGHHWDSTRRTTKVRALIAGSVALARRTTTPVKVIVQLATVWEAWRQPKSRGPFQDILEDITSQDLERVTVLYISRNTRTPDAPGNEPQLR